MRIDLPTLRSFAAALLLATAPWPAFAAPPTAADVEAFQAMTGLDHVMKVAAKSMSDTLPAGIDPPTHTCLVRQIDAAFAGILDDATGAALTHEVADQWRAFAATPAGTRFMAMLRDSWEGKALLDGATIRSTFPDAEFQALGRFVKSPAYAVFNDMRARIAATDRMAIATGVMQACNVKR
jgi:hypothetical protein